MESFVAGDRGRGDGDLCWRGSDQKQVSSLSEKRHSMGEDIIQIGNNSNYNEEEEEDTESNTLNQPLVKANRTLSSTPLAFVGAKVSHIESLDYEINENDLFKHDWRKRSKTQVLQYIFWKWTLACLVGLFTGFIATLINY